MDERNTCYLALPARQRQSYVKVINENIVREYTVIGQMNEVMLGDRDEWHNCHSCSLDHI